MTVPRTRPSPVACNEGPHAARLDSDVERTVDERAPPGWKEMRRPHAGGNGHRRRRPSGRHKSGRAQPANQLAGTSRKTSGQKTDPRTIRAAALKSKSLPATTVGRTDNDGGRRRRYHPLRRWTTRDGRLVPLRGGRKFLRAQQKLAGRWTSKWASRPTASTGRRGAAVGTRVTISRDSLGSLFPTGASVLRGDAPVFTPNARGSTFAGLRREAPVWTPGATLETGASAQDRPAAVPASDRSPRGAGDRGA